MFTVAISFKSCIGPLEIINIHPVNMFRESKVNTMTLISPGNILLRSKPVLFCSSAFFCEVDLYCYYSAGIGRPLIERFDLLFIGNVSLLHSSLFCPLASSPKLSTSYYCLASKCYGPLSAIPLFIPRQFFVLCHFIKHLRKTATFWFKVFVRNILQLVRPVVHSSISLSFLQHERRWLAHDLQKRLNTEKSLSCKLRRS